MELHTLTQDTGGGLHSMNSAARPPTLVDVSVEGWPLRMELDTGMTLRYFTPTVPAVVCVIFGAADRTLPADLHWQSHQTV